MSIQTLKNRLNFITKLIWKTDLIFHCLCLTVLFMLSLELQKSMVYRPVKIRGEFDHSNEIYLGPRPINKQQQGLASNEVGFHVITPFNLIDSG